MFKLKTLLPFLSRTKRKYADTDDSTASESDSDHSDYTIEDQENEHEIDPWASLKMKAMKKKFSRA